MAAKTEVIDWHQARQAQEEGAHMLDVREKDEWEAGHIAGAIHHSLPRIASDPDLDIPADAPVVAYCKAGGRAQRAADILAAAGYSRVRVMRGGFSDWQAAGYPTE